METFYAIVHVDKSKYLQINENGVKILFTDTLDFYFDFKTASLLGTVIDRANVGLNKEYTSFLMRIEFDQKPDSSEFRFWNKDDGMLGEGYLVANSNEFEKAKDLLEDRIEYIRDELSELIEKCANGEIEQETVEQERGLLAHLESMHSSFLESEVL